MIFTYYYLTSQTSACICAGAICAAAGAISGEILKGLGSKILGRGKRRSERRRWIRRLSYAQNQHFVAKTSCTKTHAAAERSSIFCKISTSWQRQATRTCKDKNNLNWTKTTKNQKNRSKKTSQKKTTSRQRS